MSSGSQAYTSPIKSIQAIQAVMSASTTVNVTITAVVTAKTMLVWSGMSDNNTAPTNGDGVPKFALTTTTNVAFTRGAVSGTGVVVNVQVVEYN